MKIPILADFAKVIGKSYGCVIDDASDGDNGVTFRGLFIIGNDDKQTLRQITINDLPVGRNVDEVLRLVQVLLCTALYEYKYLQRLPLRSFLSSFVARLLLLLSVRFSLCVCMTLSFFNGSDQLLNLF